MTLRTAQRVGASALVAAALFSPVLVGSPPAGAATRLHCHAWVSDSTPKQYTDVYVHVRTRPHARVRTVAHYKTTNTPHRRRANGRGRAVIDYYISDATPGYRVRVTVTVHKHHRVAYCATAFTPHR